MNKRFVRKVAWFSAALGAAGGPLGYGTGELINQEKEKTRIEAKKCVAELGSLGVGKDIPAVCRKFMRGHDPELRPLPTADDIRRDFVAASPPSPQEEQDIKNQLAGAFIIGGLITGAAIGLNLPPGRPENALNS